MLGESFNVLLLNETTGNWNIEIWQEARYVGQNAVPLLKSPVR
jgi:hypothetical protein